MIGDAFGYLRRSDQWLRTVVIGGVLAFTGGLILLPLIPLEGYFKRVVRGSAHGARDPPVFEDWVDLSVEGLKMFLIQIAYALIPFIFIMIGVVSVGMAGITGADAGGFGAAFAFVGILLGIFAVYLIPVALTNFAYHDDLGAAFDIRSVLAGAFTKDYLIGFVLALIVGILLGFIGGILMIVVIGIFILFYVQVMTYFILATGAARGLNLENAP